MRSDDLDARIPYRMRKRLGLDVGEGWKKKESAGRRSVDRTYPTFASPSPGGGDPQSDHDDGIKVGFEETPSQATLREPTRGASMNKLAFAFLTEIEKTGGPRWEAFKAPFKTLHKNVTEGYKAEGPKGAAQGVVEAAKAHPLAAGAAALGGGAILGGLAHRVLFGGKKKEKE